MKHLEQYRATLMVGILTIMCLLCGCFSKEVYEDPLQYNGDTFALYEIELPHNIVEIITSDTQITYDAKKLQKIIDQAGDVYVYGNPKATGERIVTLFGFDKDSYEVFGESGETRFYRDETNNKKTLEIDEYGCFIYSGGLEPVNENCDFSDEQCMKMGREYLLELELWPLHQINDKGRISVISNTSGDVTTIVEKGIVFYPKNIGGREASGTKRISVFFNANLEVTKIIYNWREYESRRNADLISVEEAISRVKKGNFKMDFSNVDFGSAKEISIKDVLISYWDNPSNTEETAVQPVYIFFGTAKDTNEHESEIYITVQANQFLK